MTVGALGALGLRGEVVINELHYETSDEGAGSEFVELYNAGDIRADLGGWFLSDGLFYQIPAGTALDPDQYLVIGANPGAVRAAWGVSALGPWRGRLSNEGDRVVLRDPQGNERDRVDYGVGFPWPTASAGSGSSMELIHPALDNNLGGSWRASLVPGAQSRWPADPVYLIPKRSYGWACFKGRTPPSDPPDAWRQPGFVTNAFWIVGRASFGFGDDDDFTELTDMLGGYSSVYLRREFVLPNPAALPALTLRVYTDHGCIVWLNGIEIARFHAVPADPEFDDLAGEPSRAPRWEEVHWPHPLELPLAVGTNVLAVQALAAQPRPATFSVDLELLVPAAHGQPTPGRRNSVFAEQAPPQLRQVTHEPAGPRAGDPLRVTVKATDPDGVGRVVLHYQVVPPGQYLPAFLPVPHDILLAAPDTPRAANPAFEDPANWIELAMLDDGRNGDLEAGDDVYTAVIPAQANRTLVRYRITATDQRHPASTVTVPYPDDASLNFAAFVYDGVPPYRPGKQTVHPEGLGHTYPVEVMTSLPVYHLLVREQDFLEAHAYDPDLRLPQWRIFMEERHPAFEAFNWEGALVYGDEVYDHAQFRLRQDNSRYGERGKRSLRFRFNPGHRFQARNEAGQPYPVRWRSLNLGSMSDLFEVGNYGLPEWMNFKLWNLSGVPAPWAFHVQLRVVDGPDEAPAGIEGQYTGDFWGMYLAVEDYEPAFLEAHGLPDGNLYKLSPFELDGTQLERHHGRRAAPGDADFQNVWRNVNVSQSEDWLRAQVNYPLWFRYFAVAEAVRHTDFAPAPSHNKNQAWFFEPTLAARYGRLWVLPWDADLTWGPSFVDSAMDYPRWAMYTTNGLGHVALRQETRGVLRDLRQFLWRPEIINPMLDRKVDALREFSRAERDRWRGAPHGFDDVALDEKAEDMKNFAFVGWQGANGLPVGEGGRAAYLDEESMAEHDDLGIPNPPVVTYSGPPDYPVDSLWFDLSSFRDPQGDETFGALRWRVAEVGEDPSQPPLEWNSVWQSEPERVWTDRRSVPGDRLRPGARYRVRAQVSDLEGRWSRWSEPVEFVAGEPQAPPDWKGSLRVTEIMYHAPGGSEFDYLEFENIGAQPLDLTRVTLDGSVSFNFASGTVSVLRPFERVVLVEDYACFRQRYPDPLIRVAGEYRGNFPNSGGVIALADAWTGEFLRVAYDDDWYPTTDGLGPSLVVRDPPTPQGSGLGKAGWQASPEPLGSPGWGDDHFDRDGDGMPDLWEYQHGLRFDDPSDAASDTDGDGLSALDEYLAGTDPGDARSTLRLSWLRTRDGIQLSYPTVPAGGAEEVRGRRRYQVEFKALPNADWQPVQLPSASTGGTVVVSRAISAGDPPTLFRLRIWFEP